MNDREPFENEMMCIARLTKERDALKQRVDDLLVALQEARINFWAGNSADGSISEATFDDFVTGHNLKIDAVLRSGK